MKRVFISLAAVCFVVCALAGGRAITAQAQAPSPTPSVAPSATPTEMPGVDTLFPARARGGPHASPTPPVPQRIGIEGVWELALQRGATTTYTHLQLRQQQNALTGIYIDSSNKRVPAVGIVDGNNVRIVVTYADGSTLVFTGTLDGTTDMIGMLTTPTGQVPFSGDYRPKENFFDNINDQPGGLSNPFPSPPPR